MDFLKKVEEGIKNKYNLKIKLEIKKEKKNDNSTFYNISCLYKLYDPFDGKYKEYKDDNILNSSLDGFQFMLQEINNILEDN